MCVSDKKVAGNVKWCAWFECLRMVTTKMPDTVQKDENHNVIMPMSIFIFFLRIICMPSLSWSIGCWFVVFGIFFFFLHWYSANDGLDMCQPSFKRQTNRILWLFRYICERWIKRKLSRSPNHTTQITWLSAMNGFACVFIYVLRIILFLYLICRNSIQTLAVSFFLISFIPWIFSTVSVAGNGCQKPKLPN